MIPAPPLCSIPRSHQPQNRTLELHHVIPVAWQLTTPVATPPFPGPDQDGRGQLWDCRTVALCPTHHRNVHYWIVKLMQLVALVPSQTESGVIATAYRSIGAQARRMAEPPIALEALQRFQPYGSLRSLIAAGEWGDA